MAHAAHLLGFLCFIFPLSPMEPPPIQPQKAVPKVQTVNLAGYYLVEGKDDEDNKYQGLAMIVVKDDVHIVKWFVGDGAPVIGVGLIQDKVFSVSWVGKKGDHLLRGLNTYSIQDGKLAGSWSTLPGSGQRNPETLTLLKKTPLDM